VNLVRDHCDDGRHRSLVAFEDAGFTLFSKHNAKKPSRVNKNPDRATKASIFLSPPPRGAPNMISMKDLRLRPIVTIPLLLAWKELLAASGLPWLIYLSFHF
jgi:hypothetical protein